MAALLVGCGGSAGDAGARVTREGLVGPGAPVASAGLEVVVLRVEDRDGAVARVFGPWWARASGSTGAGASSGPWGEREREVWAANGVRLVPVPIAELERVVRRLPTVGAVRRNAMGELLDWTVIFTAAAPGRLALRAGMGESDSGELATRGGVVRVLARAWRAVDAERPEGRALQVEIVPQHVAELDEATQLRRRLGVEPTPGVLEEGLILRRFALSGAWRAGEAMAVALVAEEPGVDWARVAEDAMRMGAAGGRGVGETKGPQVPSAPDLGRTLFGPEEQLIEREGEEPRRRSVRTVVVLVPRVE